MTSFLVRLSSMILFCVLLNLLVYTWNDYYTFFTEHQLAQADTPKGLIRLPHIEEGADAIPWSIVLSLLVPLVLSFMLAMRRNLAEAERGLISLLGLVVVLAMAFYWAHLMRSYPAHYRVQIPSSSAQREGVADIIAALSWLSCEALLWWHRLTSKKMITPPPPATSGVS